MSLIKLLRPFSLAITLAAVGACGGSSQPAAQQPKASATTAADPSCPVTVPGTSVAVEDTNTGAALVFVTTSDVVELRKRVATMAQMHNDHHGSMGPLPDGNAAGAGHAGHDMGGHAGHDMGGHAGHDMGGGGDHAGHDMSGGGKHAGHAGGMIGVHSKAAASDVEGGAKIAFTANGADAAKLQGELRMHAQHLASGSCEMGKL
jgi:hypothetical protein